MAHNSSSDSWLYEDGYSAGEKAGESNGVAKERQAIREWVNENRTFIEFDAGDGFYREHASLQDLLDFLDSRK